MIKIIKCGPEDFDEEDNECDYCQAPRDVIWYVQGGVNDIFMCTDCLKDLRSKIDAFRLLVTTGAHTK